MAGAAQALCLKKHGERSWGLDSLEPLIAWSENLGWADGRFNPRAKLTLRVGLKEDPSHIIRVEA